MSGKKRKPVEKLERLAWTIEDAAASTGMSRGYFRKVIDAGELPILRAGRRVLIRDCDLRAWIDSNLVNGKENES